MPLVQAFQAAYPKVHVYIFVTQRMVDPIADGIDLMLRVGELADSSLIARPLLRYRHQLVASPSYLTQAGHPQHPRDLLDHRLVAFSLGILERQWHFKSLNGTDEQMISFSPHLAMNDYAGVAAALLAGLGIGDLPPLVRADLLQDRQLVEVMPTWRFAAQDLSIVHLGNRHAPRPVRLFKDLALKMSATLLPTLPV